MSENESTEDEGYVIEGNTEIATRGHLAIYSVTSGRVDYSSFVQVARSLELTRPFVPEIRRLKDSFAIARGNLEGLTLPPLEVAEGWDSPVDRTIKVVSLSRGNEYAVQVESRGRARGKNDVRRENLFGLEFQPPENFNAAEWRTAYMDNVWEGKSEEAQASLSQITQCLTVTPFWDDMSVDGNLFARITAALMEEYQIVATSIDQKMLRDRIVRVLTSELGGLPYRSGQGIYFIPKVGDDDDYLTTLTNYSTLLENFGNANALQGTSSENNWFDESGRPRAWHRPRTNLRVLGYIDNERQMNYIRQDIQTNIGREIAEYQQKVLEVAQGFDEDNVDRFEERLKSLSGQRDALRVRVSNLTTMLGGDIDLHSDPYADVADGIATRVNSIRAVRSGVAERLSNLTLL